MSTRMDLVISKSIFRHSLARRQRDGRSQSSRRRWLGCEFLEERALLAGVTVDTTTDSSNDGNTSSIAALLLNPGTDGRISLREAITAANNTTGPDTIGFDSAGVFATPQTITLGGTQLAITDIVVVTGTGAANLTIDAAGGSRIFNIDDNNTFPIPVELVAFTLTGGNAGTGGAIFSRESLTLRDSVISGSTASTDGGGIYSVIRGTTTIQNSSFSGNSSSRGGGIFSRNFGTMSIQNSTFSGNTASYGGGLYSYVDVLDTTTIQNSAFSGNSATIRGGGIYSHVKILGVTAIQSISLSGNSASNGGGIYSNNQGTTTIQNSTLSGNSATDRGGGVVARNFASSGTTTIRNSTISGNSATSRGGGIYSQVANDTTTIQNSTIAGNSASIGGGLYSRSLGGGTTNLTSSIVAGNMATSSAPDFWSFLSFGAVTVTSSLIGDNTGSGLSEAQPPTPDANGNLVGNPSGAGIINPLLGPLAGNGGPTQTRSLLTGSPALDRGSNPAGLTSDQRGMPFLRDGGSGVDMGAYEAQSLALLVDIISDVDNGNFAAGDLSLREAIRLANANFGPDTISFDTAGVFAAPRTITLTGGQLPTITDGVTITGTGAANLTIQGNNLSRIFILDNGNNSLHIPVELVAMTLTGGNASGVFPANRGGAIFSRESLTLRDSVVSGNSATGGGGIYVRTYSGGTTTIQNSTLSGNSAGYLGGGGIHSRNNGTTTIQNSMLSGNSAISGGGISSVTSGGGTTTIGSSTLSGNSANTGGGLYSRVENGSTTTIQNSTFSGNSASNGGGINSRLLGSSTTAIENSTLAGNIATSSGGGIWSRVEGGSTTRIRSSTLSGNSADRGGGIAFVNYSTTNLTSSIIAGNTATISAPDLQPIVNSGTLTVTFSLIGDNTGSGLGEAQIPNANGNLVGNPAGAGIINPRLGPLADNGGQTLTRALLAGSPALNLGSNPTLFMSDQRGAPFLRDDGNGVDMGAYERQTVAGLNLVVDTTVDENDGDYSADDLSLREAIGLANGSVGPDTIHFDTVLFATPQTILLGGTQLPTITDALTISGTGSASLIIDANGMSRIFNLDDGSISNHISVELVAMTLTGGNASLGGAIRSLENLTIRNATISGNSASSGGGIYSRTYGGSSTTIRNSTLSGNSASNRGGGIYSRTHSGGTTTIQNSTLSGNSASLGGGVDSLNEGATNLTSSIVAGNAATTSAPDLRSFVTSGTVTVTFSLIGDNTGSGLSESQTPNVNGNLVGDPLGAGIIDPLLGALAHNGGPTQTRALLAGSPALDRGSNPAGLTTDQRGARFLRDDGSGVDMGAYEAQSLALLVDTNSDVDDGNFALGDLSLREAIRLANANPGGDAIGFDTAGLFATPQSITLAGVQLPTITEALTIAGTGAANLTINGNNLSRIFNLDDGNNGIPIVVELAAMTLTGGNVSGAFPGGAGGAIFSRESLTLRDSVVSGNSASQLGGGIFARVYSGGALTIQNSTLAGNTANAGGGILAHVFNGGASTIQNSLLSGNSASQSGGGIFALNYSGGASTIQNNSLAGNSAHYGGGIYNFGTTMIQNNTLSENVASDRGGGIFSSGVGTTLQNNTFSGNSANFRGGGIYSRVVGGGSTTIQNSTFSGNSAINAGGGIFSQVYPGGTMTIQNSTFSGNSAHWGGGISSANFYYQDFNGTTTIRNCTLSGNTANTGGGIYSRAGYGGATTIQNSTLSGNSATAGGGIASINLSTTTIQNSTLSGNSASHSGGGIVSVNHGTMNLRNSIVAGNTATTVAADLRWAPTSTSALTVTFSFIGDNTDSGLNAAQPPMPDANGNFVGTAANPLNPLLGPLADNGGPTQTMALLAGSQAMDAGNPMAVAGMGNVPLHDQRGAPFTRVYDGDGVGGARIDMGAFEAQPTPDTDPPTASGSAADITTTGGTNHTISVIFSDNVLVDFSTLGAGDIEVVAPDNSIISASLVAATPMNNAPSISAIYQVTAPGGVWGAGDNGIYTIQVVGSQVSDTAGLFVAAGILGTFEVDILVTCDFDGNDLCNVLDLDLLVAEIVSGANTTAFDLTNDNLVNLDDRDAWLALAGAANLPSGNPYLLGDADLDGVVDGSDFITWNSNKFMARPFWSAGDFNADGFVDGSDFIIWNANKFTSADTPGRTWLPLPLVGRRELNERDAESIAPDPCLAHDRIFAMFAGDLSGNM